MFAAETSDPHWELAVEVSQRDRLNVSGAYFLYSSAVKRSQPPVSLNERAAKAACRSSSGNARLIWSGDCVQHRTDLTKSLSLLFQSGRSRR